MKKEKEKREKREKKGNEMKILFLPWCTPDMYMYMYMYVNVIWDVERNSFKPARVLYIALSANSTLILWCRR